MRMWGSLPSVCLSVVYMFKQLYKSELLKSREVAAVPYLKA